MWCSKLVVGLQGEVRMISRAFKAAVLRSQERVLL